MSVIILHRAFYVCVFRTRVYMSDLESALHYSLRVELSSHIIISGEDLTALKKYIDVLAKVSHVSKHTLNIHFLKYLHFYITITVSAKSVHMTNH